MKVPLYMILIVATVIPLCAPSCGGGGGGGSRADITTPQYGAIEGYVYAPVGSGARAAAATPTGFKAVADVSVNVSCGSAIRNSTTNNNGYFSISSLPAGSCSVQISKSGFQTYQASVTVSANKTTTIGGTNGIQLSPTSSGSLKVSANVAGGEIIIDGESTNIMISQSLTITLSDIAVGSHTVSIEKQGYESVDSQTVSVSQDETAEVNFIMNPEGNIAPIANAGTQGKAFVGYRYEWNESTSSYLQRRMDYSLDGRGSSDANSDDLTFEWVQISGPATTIEDADSSEAVFNPTMAETYRFRLTVSDGYLEDSSEIAVEAYELSGKLTFYAYPITSEIFTMNADGTEYSQLTGQSTSDSHPHWSPDGSRIAYSADNGTDTFMALINSAGTGQTTTGIEYGASDWFDDNAVLTYKYYSGSLDYYKINTDETNEQRLTFTDVRGMFAKISPDGSKIAFTKNYGGDNYEIVVMDSNGSNITRLTNNSTTETYFAWLDSNRIIYETHNFIGDKTRGIFVMNADGTNVTEIPIPAGLTDIESNITASADGQFIFLTDQNNKLSVMFADGSNWVSYGRTGYNPDYHPGP